MDISIESSANIRNIQPNWPRTPTAVLIIRQYDIGIIFLACISSYILGKFEALARVGTVRIFYGQY